MSSKQLPHAVQPEGWARPIGYSNGMVAEGRMVFVAGQVGWDPTSATPKFPPTFAGQFGQALSNVVAVVKAAGGGPEHIVRLTVYVTDKREYLISLKEVGEAWRQHMGKRFPAMALMQVAGLVEEDAKLEIEATAVL
ncbi:MAG: putative translation initiation inhibitor, yjgF family [Myxococcaceae bacterium]|nr:putative translation initiation inhibitor, yjgF family [Myxococcaceae bacterium]